MGIHPEDLWLNWETEEGNEIALYSLYQQKLVGFTYDLEIVHRDSHWTLSVMVAL